MKSLLGKVLHKSDVGEIIDAAAELDKAEGKLIESLLSVYGKLYKDYANEVLPNLREPVVQIYDAGREYSLLMNNTFRQRVMKQSMEKIRTERDVFKKVKEEHEQIEKRLKASEATLKKHQQEVDKLEKKGKTSEAEKVKDICINDEQTVKDNLQALDEHSEFMELENEAYQKKIVEIVTDFFEKMLTSTLECLEKSHESALAMAEQLETMEMVDQADEIRELETQLSAITSELEHMERMETLE